MLNRMANKMEYKRWLLKESKGVIKEDRSENRNYIKNICAKHRSCEEDSEKMAKFILVF